MTTFEKLRQTFIVNWTTVLVGWKGLGVYSPWPNRRGDFPPLLSVSEIAAYADERLVSASDPTEIDLLEELLSLNLQGESRETIESLLDRLSDLDRRDPTVELRKWRVVRLEELLETMPKDALYGLIALTEFWQEFGFPSDSPHEVQGRENTTAPEAYYQQENLDRILSRHMAWVKDEILAIKTQEVHK
jgi:hypothetical protein